MMFSRGEKHPFSVSRTYWGLVGNISHLVYIDGIPCSLLNPSPEPYKPCVCLCIYYLLLIPGKRNLLEKPSYHGFHLLRNSPCSGLETLGLSQDS